MRQRFTEGKQIEVGDVCYVYRQFRGGTGTPAIILSKAIVDGFESQYLVAYISRNKNPGDAHTIDVETPVRGVIKCMDLQYVVRSQVSDEIGVLTREKLEEVRETLQKVLNLNNTPTSAGTQEVHHQGELGLAVIEVPSMRQEEEIIELRGRVTYYRQMYEDMKRYANQLSQMICHAGTKSEPDGKEDITTKSP